jgi:hypothetical protein
MSTEKIFIFHVGYGYFWLFLVWFFKFVDGKGRLYVGVLIEFGNSGT